MKTLRILTAILLLPLLSFGQQLGIGVSPSYVATHKAQDTSTPTPSGDALTMTADVDAEQVVTIYVIFTGSLTVDWGDGSEPEAMVGDGETPNSHEYASADAYDISITGDLTALTLLGCSSNSLTSLDVSSCTALTLLNCPSNSLTSLDVSSCTALSQLYCQSNSITDLSVSTCVLLNNLECYSNSLTESAITTLIGTMVDWSEGGEGNCIITPMSETFPQMLTTEQCATLLVKSWMPQGDQCPEE